jgi:hypothetical protein
MRLGQQNKQEAFYKEPYSNEKPLLKIVTKEKTKEGKDEVRSGNLYDCNCKIWKVR